MYNHDAQTKLIASSRPISSENNFYRSCSLCFDSSVALTTTENRIIELYNLQPFTSSQTSQAELAVWKRFPQAGNIICTSWYPMAVPEDPSTFCFLASVKDCPIKLLDGSDGRHRASYRLVDHRERHIAPYSLSFNSFMTKIYCGFQNAIEVFDVNYPGEGDRILTTPTKKSSDGVKGIVSSLAFSPDYSGLYAAGTFTSYLVAYDENSPGEIVCYFGGVLGPVTQIKYHPTRPHLLLATSRQTGKILCWDMRGNISSPLLSFERPGLSNQRIMFDIDADGNLATGDTEGFASFFNLCDTATETLTYRFKAHNDTISSVALHKTDSMMLSVSGSRHFDGYQPKNQENNRFESDAESSEESDNSNTYAVKQLPFSTDMSIKLWNVPFFRNTIESV